MSYPRLSITAVVLAFLACWSLATQPAQAYLDPGTGSYLFQIALASLFGALFGLKMFWIQIKTGFLKLFGKSPAPASAQTQETKDV